MFIIAASNKITKQIVYLMDFDLVYIFTEDDCNAYEFNTESDAFQVVSELKIRYPTYEFKVKQRLLY